MTDDGLSSRYFIDYLLGISISDLMGKFIESGESPAIRGGSSDVKPAADA